MQKLVKSILVFSLLILMACAKSENDGDNKQTSSGQSGESAVTDTTVTELQKSSQELKKQTDDVKKKVDDLLKEQ